MTIERRAAEARTSDCVACLAAEDTATEHLTQSAVRVHGRLRALADMWYVDSRELLLYQCVSSA